MRFAGSWTTCWRPKSRADFPTTMTMNAVVDTTTMTMNAAADTTTVAMTTTVHAAVKVTTPGSRAATTNAPAAAGRSIKSAAGPMPDPGGGYHETGV